MTSRPPLSRHVRGRWLLLALAVGLGGCQSSGQPTAGEAAQDEAARVEYYEQAAKTYYEGGKYAQAVLMWDKVLAARPEDPWAKFGLAKSLQMQGTVQSLRRAQAILEPIVDQPWVHPTRGDIRFEVQTTLATVYSDLADFYDRDMRALEERVRKDPNADNVTIQQQLQRQKSVRDQLLRASMPLWHQVLAGSPENQYALAGLAKANLLAGDEGSGIHYATRYVELSRRSQTGWRQQMANYQETKQGGMTAEERKFFQDKMHGAREKELGMLLLLGSVHMRRDEFQLAVQRYNDVLEIDPAEVAALVERAQAYAGLGMYREAVADLEEYLKLTDARRQREARINAAELLDRYRTILARQPAAPAGTSSVPARATPGGAFPPSR